MTLKTLNMMMRYQVEHRIVPLHRIHGYLTEKRTPKKELQVFRH